METVEPGYQAKAFEETEEKASGEGGQYKGNIYILVLIKLVGKFRFLNEYGDLETVKPGDQGEAFAGTAVGDLGAGVLSIVSYLYIFFVLTEENGLVCCFPPDGGIWVSGKMVEAAATAAVGGGSIARENGGIWGGFVVP